MAKTESIPAVETIQISIDLLRSFCLAVHDANPVNPPSWIDVVSHHIEQIREALETADTDVGGAEQ